jgi:putative glutamine amidotransferase
MTKRPSHRLIAGWLLPAALLVLVFASTSAAPCALLPGKLVRLAVLYPSVETIKDIEALRARHLLEVPGLSVVGVYHERETTDYAAARRYVEAHHLDWFTFHPIAASLSPEPIFAKNALTPEFRKIFDQCSGVIFFGGPDIPPELYGEKMSLLTEVRDPIRHYLELSFVFHLLGGSQDEKFKPLLGRRHFAVLGICLGCQSLNVGTGGTLTQDIWSETYGKNTVEDVIALGRDNWHTNPLYRLDPSRGLFASFLHPIKLDSKGFFCARLGFASNLTPTVLSAHHQQIKKLGKGFRVMATSLDGRVIEAVEHERFADVLGVQFHPEAFDLYDPDFRTRFGPDQASPISLLSVLENNPPSLEFHKKIWAWFGRALVD